MTGLSRGDAPAALWRRLLAILYDALLLCALLLVAFLPAPLIPEAQRFSSWGRGAMFAWALLVSFLFFGWFWTHGGQTLGMRAWRIYLISADGARLRWSQALLRFAAALVSWGVVGLGFVWSLFEPKRRTWHDIWSGTVVLTRPRRPRPRRRR